MSTTLKPVPPRSTRPRSAQIPTDSRHLGLVEADASPVGALADRAVVRWLTACALAVAIAVAVGGITRLTESGLSITEWKPVSGVLPPLGGAEWSGAFERYLAIPEAQTVHRGITMTEFKRLFWWEWTHRMLARGVGLVLAVPFFVLLMRRQVRPNMRLRLMNLPLLAALQGTMGWYMVQSGLSGRTGVSPYRLVAHLAVALVILGIAVWTAAELSTRSHDGSSQGTSRSSRAGLGVAIVLAALLFVTILSGGFVAGLDAGKVFNTFPLMEGHIVPVGYGLIPGWRNAFENPIAAQLHHRILAVSTVALVWAAWMVASIRGWRSAVRRWLAFASAAAALQLVLGIVTIVQAVPIPVAVLHQLGALVLLSILLVFASRECAVGA